MISLQSILLTAEGMEDLNVPIIRENESPDVPVRVWKDRLVAIDQGQAAANWINKFLETDRGTKEFRLFRVKDSFKRPTDPKYAPHSETGRNDYWNDLLVRGTHGFWYSLCRWVPISFGAGLVAA